MIVLDNPNRKLEMLLAAPPATTQLPSVACWLDSATPASYSGDNPPAYAPSMATGLTTGTTAAPLAPPPAAGVVRQVSFLSIRNSDSAAVTLTVRVNDAQTLAILWAGTLAAGATLQYTEDRGFFAVSATAAAVVAIDQTTPGTTDSVTVATGQGAGATIGTTADAVVAAGATGTVAAKLRRATQGIEDLKTLIVLATSANVIGHVIADSGSTTVVTGTVAVSAAALPLPTGASTDATLATLSAKVTTCNTGAVVLAAGAALIGKVGIDQTTPGTTNAVAATNFPTTLDTNSGAKSASTVRVVLATDQPQLTAKLLVTPDANSAVNVAQLAGTTADTNSGNKSAGTLRVVLATDQPNLTAPFNVDTELPAAAALADGAGNPTAPAVGAFGMAWDGTAWQRTPLHTHGVALVSAARTVSTLTATLPNYKGRGIAVWLNVTAVPAAPGAGGLQVRILNLDSTQSAGCYLNVAPALIIAVGFYGYIVYPGATAAGVAGSNQVQQSTSQVLNEKFLLYVVHSDAQSYTYSMSYSLLL